MIARLTDLPRTGMTFFEDRPGADKVEELLAKAKHPFAMSVVKWGEVYYSVWRARGEKAAAAKLHEIAYLPIEIVGVDSAGWPPVSRRSTTCPTWIASPPPSPRPGRRPWSQVTKTSSVSALPSRCFGSEGLGWSEAVLEYFRSLEDLNAE
jgi:hypothetical protein